MPKLEWDNWNGTKTVTEFTDDEIISRDIQTGRDNQIILDSVQGIDARRRGNGRIIGRIPITVWHEWRKDWKQRAYKYMTWKTYYRMKLNNPDFKKLLTERV